MRLTHWFVYSWHHIDSSEFIRPAIDENFAWAGSWDLDADQLLEVCAAFKLAGWEGDGALGIIWIPPFIAGDENYGMCIWHVKQDNNGTSWLGSLTPLPWRELLSQNPEVQKFERNGIRNICGLKWLPLYVEGT